MTPNACASALNGQITSTSLMPLTRVSLYFCELLAALMNNTFFGDGQAKGGLGEMPSASGRDTVPCMHSGESGKWGNPSCDAPSGWTATERAPPSADLAVLSTGASEGRTAVGAAGAAAA